MANHQRIPLLQSPLQLPGQPTTIGQLEGYQSKKRSNDDESLNNGPYTVEHDDALFKDPVFQQHEKTLNIQLFFDLFFVANLTNFTGVHPINSLDSLTSYIGFFCVLWTTWCQITLYDVRFATDTLAERVAHACHFAVMVGLAAVGPKFDPGHADADLGASKNLCYILMASRLTLTLQYALTMLLTWKFSKTRLPLALMVGTTTIAWLCYLGFSFAFVPGGAHSTYIGWYVIGGFEIVATVIIASRWDIVSFRQTHLVERMTCLTLIVLGEGIIGLCLRLALIQDLDDYFNGSTIGSIIAAVLIIYLAYQLYFDNLVLDHFGNIRQQIWAFLHFPFHLALVLLMEGINQLFIWRHFIVTWRESVYAPIEPYFNGNYSNFTPDVKTELFQTMNDTVQSTFQTFWPNDTISPTTPVLWKYVQEQLGLLDPQVQSNAAQNDTQFETTLFTLLSECMKIMADAYGFEPPEQSLHYLEDAPVEEQLNAYYAVFELVFAYFFISAGFVLIFISLLTWMSKIRPQRTWRVWVGMIANFLLGTALCLLALANVTNESDKLGGSPWTLPLLMFVFGIALCFNLLPRERAVNVKKEI